MYSNKADRGFLVMKGKRRKERGHVVRTVATGLHAVRNLRLRQKFSFFANLGKLNHPSCNTVRLLIRGMKGYAQDKAGSVLTEYMRRVSDRNAGKTDKFDKKTFFRKWGATREADRLITDCLEDTNVEMTMLVAELYGKNGNPFDGRLGDTSLSQSIKTYQCLIFLIFKASYMGFLPRDRH